MTDARRLVDKLWSYCNVLRDDGVGTIEYTEQLTYLLFLKMAHERDDPGAQARADRARASAPGSGCSTPTGADLESTYTQILEDSAGSPARSARSSARRRTASRTRPSSSG